MIFTYQHWDNFCRELAEKGVKSIPTRDIKASTTNYVVLKHDVETNVSKAYQLAAIEHKYGHRGSYYVQAYLLHDEKNIFMLREMQEKDAKNDEISKKSLKGYKVNDSQYIGLKS